MEVVKSVNLDANESAFFARELESIKARTYDILYPEYKATRLLPVSTEAGSGAESIVYRQYDSVGLMKVIADYADDLPRSDVKGKEFTSPVRSLGGSYGYSLQEVRAANQANKPLTTRKAEAVRRAYEQAVNRIAWKARPGDSVNGGLTSLLYNPNITITSAPAGATTTNTKWVDPTPANEKNAEEILKDMNDIVNTVIDLTKGIEVPDTMIMPVRHYTKVSTTRLASGTDTTILQYFLNNNPTIKNVEWVNELKDVSPLPSTPSNPSSSGSLLAVYRNDPSKITLELPQIFEMLPVQERGLEFIIPAHARIGGVIIYYPLSVHIYEGV